MLPGSPTARTVVAKDFPAAEGVGVNEGDYCSASMRTDSSIVSCLFHVAVPPMIARISAENTTPDVALADAGNV